MMTTEAMERESIEESRRRMARFLYGIRRFPDTPEAVDEDISLINYIQGIETGRRIERLREAAKTNAS